MKNGISISCASLCMASLLSGCTTHLEAGKALASDPSSRRGIAYYLSFTQFEVEASWTVTDCSNGLKLMPKVSATPTNAADPAAIYTIDYASLDAWTKTSSVKVEFYDSGAIKSINASADDRTAEIAAKTIEAVGKVAAFAAAGGPGAASPLKCSAALIKSLEDIKVQTGEVARLSAQLARYTANLDALTIRVVESGAAVPRSILNAQDQAVARVASAQMALDAARTNLEKVKAAAVYSSTETFPRTSDGALKVSLSLSPKILADWLDNPQSMVPPGGTIETALDGYIKQKTMFVEVSSQGGWENGTDYDGTSKTGRLAGIRYRMAVPATLKACLTNFCSTAADDLTQPEAVDELPVKLIARGTTFYLPFHSAPMTNASLSATFSEAGVLTSAGYEQKKAAGEAMATTAALLADQVVTVGGKIREGRKTPIEKVKEETDLANAIADRDAAKRRLEASPDAATLAQSATIKADTELKNAQIDNARADLALKEARDARLAAGMTP